MCCPSACAAGIHQQARTLTPQTQARPRALQQGSTRKRKDANIADIKVAVHLFAFDCLYYNGRSLLSEPLEERRSILHSALKETDDELSFAVSKAGTLSYGSALYAAVAL